MNHSDAIQNNVSLWRILVFAVVIAVVFSVYVGRLFLLQIVEGAGWLAQADENRTNRINLPAPRGIIYDRNGYVLARNIASYNVVITPANLPDDPAEIQNIYRQLSSLIDVPVSRSSIIKDDPDYQPYVPCQSDHGIAQIVEYGDTTSPYQSVKIKCNVEESVAKIVQEKAVDWPGVSIEIEPIRDYPTGFVTADVIGYLGPISEGNKDYYEKLGFVTDRDKIGYTGIERSYQDILAGKNGLRLVEKDAAGKILRDLQAPIPSEPGKNIYLTIDTRLQAAGYAIVEDELNWWNRYFSDKPDKQMTSAVAIALNPRTGEILAMISYPTYENNRMARVIPSYYYKQLIADKRKPLVNHAVGDELPAGSVFKLSTAMGGLNEGIITPEKIIETPGQITIMEKAAPNAPVTLRNFVDWNREGFGKLDFVHAIAYSSNVYFYKVGGGYTDEVPNGGLGICRLGSYARGLGYGALPGTGLPEEVSGLIPDPTYKRVNGGESWTLGDTYISSVGQGYVLATPLQVLMSDSTMANDGKLMQPTLIRDIVDEDGKVLQPFTPVLKWDLTVDPVIEEYYPDPSIRGCEKTGNKKTVQSWIFDKIKEGMRLAVVDDRGTLHKIYNNVNIAVAGKTGTAEYCDEFAKLHNPCTYGNWPTHGWTISFAPFDNPEIAVVAFVYNGGEGASSAAPIVKRIIQAYFDLKAADNANVKP